ncbi:hypothetical protein SAMN05421837_10738 [Amycolatopsis pretoriensis]|uniref:Septum formation n=1 Tax=Amycolatopsis pretoriensis TaxID=218821 RepID=A0A1H5R5Q8_9PSEU|nr:hypothetical protein [Amycolatopsis pretoriensis]SEF33770.1 hypothetical protein SAMN05421837_10738 [Amycolatopsis pretoriensis]
MTGHDPELFDELMREERRRARPATGRRVVAGLVAFGVLMLAGGLAYRAANRGEQLPEGTAHGLDVTAGQCFWSPTGTGEVDVLLRSCTEGHTAEAFAVLPLPEGADAPYQATLDRCTAAAHPISGARVQVMTPHLQSSEHQAVCYYRFGAEMTTPAR